MLGDKVTQIEKTTISQNIVQQLIDLILNGTIGHGEKLPSEKQLMELFKVGRSSLREAIRSLVTLGLIEVRVPEGTFVKESFGDFFTKHLGLMSRISFENIAELIEARTAIESDIAELAAVKVTEEDLAKLEERLDLMKEANKSGDNEKFLQSDLQFHFILAEIGRNSFMLHVMTILRDISREWIKNVIQLETSKELAIQQHEKVLHAVKQKNAEAARIAMKEHLHSVSELLLSIHKKESE
ncbi:FadR/GntR family transcriptional regulator [Paenibacillus sp. GCM10027626]|uniref:FadR/GntR family transcriptional regulator n=1 Tax=Paenibacillus sp. GCM10027626 TaxID=3273411 RepID=UPI0036355349